ncbi:hypothetical protein PGIGA_G00111160 [Pangasianodon gigas]|uniref:Uncharacterized protein n=1 Tax=Pangasianodon gigas TaxID=30993 RepID=A0ACC5WA85_PANGG|nr:hypothetical protein [Pangasianodon gigas]
MSSNELSAPDPEPCIRTFKEHMRLELEPPRLITSPKVSPRSSPRLFRRLMVNKGGRHRRRFTVAHTWLCSAIEMIMVVCGLEEKLQSKAILRVWRIKFE